MGGGGNIRGFRSTKGARASAKIHKGRQEKHIEGTRNYNQQRLNGKNPSILTEDPEQLFREGAGKGQSINATKEVVDYGRIIGKYYYEKTGMYYDTTRAIIHYDSKGNTHIVPARLNWLKD